MNFCFCVVLACQSPSTIETSIPFEVWSRFYYPNIRDQLLAKVRKIILSSQKEFSSFVFRENYPLQNYVV